jgi:hypothetical protein
MAAGEDLVADEVEAHEMVWVSESEKGSPAS